MSEQGWKAFLAATGVDDWAVLHGGAMAFFRTASLGAAARLAEGLAGIATLPGRGAILTLSDRGVAVRLNRDIWQLEVDDIGLARSISAVARELGGVADRSAIQEVQVAIAAKPDAVNCGFWRAVLGYAPMADDNAVDPLGHGSTVWMQELDAARPLAHAMHIDVSVPREQVGARLEAAIAAGGRIVDDSHQPAHWTLSDGAGNRVCVCAWPDSAE
ncbi:VOC family protein [Sphingomonas oligophenolica]|uniref:VOC family protein n=1 Tax=Sphingomonas oligophenolica TaxID=301154 RepID=A0ABU9Y279_9SPHN